MSSTWEIMAITILISGAVAYLCHRIWRKLRGSDRAAGCGTCAHNPAHPEANADVVSLDSLASSAEKFGPSRN